MNDDVKVEPVSPAPVVPPVVEPTPVIVPPEPAPDIVPEPAPEPPKPGEKTDPALLLNSLQDEREKRRLLEDQLKAREQELSDLKGTGGGSQSEQELRGQIAELTEKITLKDLVEELPQLKEKLDEFKEFKKDYPGVELSSVAKLYLSENGLLETPTKRKGLERTTGGGRSAPEPKFSPEEKNRLMKENPRKFRDLLKSGAFNE